MHPLTLLYTTKHGDLRVLVPFLLLPLNSAHNLRTPDISSFVPPLRLEPKPPSCTFVNTLLGYILPTHSSLSAQKSTTIFTLSFSLQPIHSDITAHIMTNRRIIYMREASEFATWYTNKRHSLHDHFESTFLIHYLLPSTFE